MGNVSGRLEKSQEFEQEGHYMEYGHGHGQAQVSSSSSYRAHMLHSPPHHSPRASQFPVMLTSQVHIAPSQTPNQIMQMQREGFNSTTAQYRSEVPGRGIPAVISWIHGGTQVAVEGSWDNWRSRELLEGSGSDFSVIKVLNAGVYHYRFVVDGQWTYDADLPHECDNLGNVFNILDLKDAYPENPNKGQEPECPSSPTSSYDNALFTLEDFSQKLPELPPLLQQMPLNQPSSSKNSHQALQKPLSANLNHLYITRGGSSQPTVALSSSQRFRSKFVTTVLYKPLKRVRK